MLVIILAMCGLYVGWRVHTRHTAFHYRKLDAEMDALRGMMDKGQGV